MSEHELVEAYLAGRIDEWGVFRRLRVLGVTAGAALAVAIALPAAVQARDTSKLDAVCLLCAGETSPAFANFLSLLAAQLENVGQGGPLDPLAVSLARLGADNIGCANCEFGINEGNVNLSGNLNAVGGNLNAAKGEENNLVDVSLNGNIGQAKVNLAGNVNVPPGPPIRGRNLNLGNVNLNFHGNVGDMPLNFAGNIGNVQELTPGDQP